MTYLCFPENYLTGLKCCGFSCMFKTDVFENNAKKQLQKWLEQKSKAETPNIRTILCESVAQKQTYVATYSGFL